MTIDEAVMTAMREQVRTRRAERDAYDAGLFRPVTALERAIRLRDSDPETYQRVYPSGVRLEVAIYEEHGRKAAIAAGSFDPETFDKESEQL